MSCVARPCSQYAGVALAGMAKPTSQTKCYISAVHAGGTICRRKVLDRRHRYGESVSAYDYPVCNISHRHVEQDYWDFIMFVMSPVRLDFSSQWLNRFERPCCWAVTPAMGCEGSWTRRYMKQSNSEHLAMSLPTKCTRTECATPVSKTQQDDLVCDDTGLVSA